MSQSQTIKNIMNTQVSEKITHPGNQEDERELFWICTIFHLQSRNLVPSSSFNSFHCDRGLDCRRMSSLMLVNYFYNIVRDHRAIYSATGCTFRHSQEDIDKIWNEIIKFFDQNPDQALLVKEKLDAIREIVLSAEGAVTEAEHFKGFAFNFRSKNFAPAMFPVFNMDVIFDTPEEDEEETEEESESEGGDDDELKFDIVPGKGSSVPIQDGCSFLEKVRKGGLPSYDEAKAKAEAKTKAEAEAKAKAEAEAKAKAEAEAKAKAEAEAKVKAKARVPTLAERLQAARKKSEKLSEKNIKLGVTLLELDTLATKCVNEARLRKEAEKEAEKKRKEEAALKKAQEEELHELLTTIEKNKKEIAEKEKKVKVQKNRILQLSKK